MSKFCLLLECYNPCGPANPRRQSRKDKANWRWTQRRNTVIKPKLIKILSLLMIMVLLMIMLMMPTTVWDSKAGEKGSRSRRSRCHLMMIMVMVVKVMMMMLTRTVWESKAGAGGPGEQVPPRLSNRHHPRLARAPLKVPSLIFSVDIVPVHSIWFIMWPPPTTPCYTWILVTNIFFR